MAPHIPVLPLKVLSLRQLSEIIVLTANTIPPKSSLAIPEETSSSVRNYLQQLPGSISQDLLYHLLFNRALLAWDSYVSLNFVLCKSIKWLATGKFPQCYHQSVLKTIDIYGGGLKHLDLRGVWLTGHELYLLKETLHHLPNLNTLLIPHMATDQILRAVGECSLPLKILDISGESQLSEVGLEALCCGCSASASLSTGIKYFGCGQTLKYVNIGKIYSYNDHIQPSEVALLLSLAPNLVSLGDYKFVGSALEHLLTNHHSKITTKLLYACDTFTTENTMQVLVALCPDLKGIYLDSPESDVIPRLSFLPRLEYVKLHRFQPSDLITYLKTGGSKLYTLKLIVGSDLLDISAIASVCQKLQELECCKISSPVFNHEIGFQELLSINLLYSQVSTTAIRRILLSARKLVHVTIGDVGDLSDESMYTILQQKCLTCIEDLTFRSAKELTIQTVKLLIEKCPFIRLIGYLKGWKVTRREFYEVQDYLKSFNLYVSVHM